MTMDFSDEEFNLTQEDVYKLLENPSADSRIEVTEKIASHYDANNFSPSQRSLAEEIFRFLLKDAEVKVRKTLSQTLQENDEVPRDIVMGLAKDVDEVSEPVLANSNILSDEDLIHIIRSTESIAKQKAVANRNNVSSAVSNALVETENPEVVSELLNNESANLTEEVFENISNSFSGDSNIIEQLQNHNAIPVALVEKIMASTTAKIKEEVTEKFGEKAATLSTAVDQSGEIETLNLLKMNPTIHEVKDLVDSLIKKDRLTPSIILHSISLGYMRFFQVAMARLANIPNENALKLILDIRGIGFQQLYHQAGLPTNLLPAMALMTKIVIDLSREGKKLTQENPKQYYNRMLEKIFLYTAGKEIEHLNSVVQVLRQFSKQS